ncbi:MAG: DUF4333 domain-containing protein [Deltaproteobacteria bacterium]|nr:DUF4333 domain-containing protein [Deltaproteobacteria bacterium]
MNHQTLRAGRIILALVPFAVAGLACKRADPEKLERGIRSKLEEKWPGAIEAVDCPDKLELKKGNNFSCTVALKGGGTMSIDVTQNDDEGNVTWKPVSSTVLVTEVVESSLQEKLSEQRGGVAITVECGDAVFLGGSVGATFECTVNGPDHPPLAVTVKQEDAEGSFSWKFKDESAGLAEIVESTTHPDSPPAQP